MLAVLYIEPLQPIFKTVPLGLRDWCLVLVAAGIPTFFMGIGSVLGTTDKKKKSKWPLSGQKTAMR